jgi:hypothetical protein
MITELPPRIDGAPPTRPRRSGLRSIMSRIGKPLAFAFVAAIMALSLTVTTTQKAEANPLLIPPIIYTGSTIMTMGEVAGVTAMIGPVGWGLLGIAAVGAGLYYTKDYWLPYVTGDFGKNKSESPAPTGSLMEPGLQYLHDANGKPVVTTPNYRTVVSLNYTGTKGSVWVDVAAIIHCKTPTGSVYTKTDQLSSPQFGTSAPYVRQGDATFYCDSAYDVSDGWIVGPPGGGSGLIRTQNSRPGPEQTIKGGVFADTAPTFDVQSPDLKYKTTVECIRSDGTKFSITAESTGDQKGVKVPSCAAAEPGAHGTGKMTVVGTPPGSTVGQTVLDRPAAAAAPGDYPMCSPAKPGPGCALAVWVDGKECVVGNWNCAHWKEIDQTRVQCNYGPYVGIPVNSCNPLERAYEEGGVPATEENTDGNPATRSDTDPNGNTVPKNSTGAGTTTVPGVGGQVDPNGSPEEKECFPTGWAALNPVEWVLKPVGCALTAAFVPKPEVVTEQTSRLDTKIKNVGFARISTAWLSTFQAAGGGSGCTGPTVNFSMEGVTQNFQPFNACSQPMAGVAATTNAISAVFIVLFGGLGIMRALGAAFGFNFSMGRGGDGD